MSPMDAARALQKRGPLTGVGGGVVFCNGCGYHYHNNHMQEHAPDCPWLAMPQIVKVLEAAEDVAHLLQMVLDNQIRNGWVAEDSPLLDEPRKALERFYAAESGPTESPETSLLS